MTSHRLVALLLCVLVVCAAAVHAQAPPTPQTPPAPPTPPTVGRDTTYYLGPLDDEGYVDYLRALEQAFGDADTANADNAFVGIFENLDTADWNADYVAALRERLNLDPPAEDADLFVGLPDFAVGRGVSEEVGREMFSAALDGTLADEHAALVDDYLASVDGPLARISAALLRPHYFAPMILLPGDHGVISVSLPHLGPHRLVARSLSIRIDRRLAADDLDAVVEDILTQHRLARLQTRESSLISTLSGFSIEANAFDGTRALLNHDQLTAAHVARLKAGFAVLPQDRPIGRVISEGERAGVLDTTQQIARGPVGLLWGMKTMDGDDPFVKLMQDPRFDQDVMLRTINAFWDEYLPVDLFDEDFFKKTLDESKLAKAIDALDLNRHEIERLVTLGRTGIPADADAEAISRRMGELMPSLLAPSPDAAAHTNTKIMTRHQLEEVGLALAEYKFARGAYPPLLRSLVPAHLDAVPMDPFTGKPLIYRRHDAGYTLYSVSSNLEDDGGLDDPSSRSDGDLVLRVGEPEPKPQE